MLTDPTGLAPWANGYYDGDYDPDYQEPEQVYGPQERPRGSSMPTVPPPPSVVAPKILVILAQDVYAGKDTQVLPDTWRRVSFRELYAAAEAAGVNPDILVGQMFDEDSGFRSDLYTNAAGQYVYAFAGTQDELDIKTDMAQSLGGETVQYNLAMGNTEKLAKIFGAENLTLTGHSLGGGLATAASAVNGVNAVTFNPAGINPQTVMRALRARGDEATSWNTVAREVGTRVTNYVIPGEMLNNLGAGSSLGRTVMLPNAGYVSPVFHYDQSSNSINLSLGALQNSVDAHSNWGAFKNALKGIEF